MIEFQYFSGCPNAKATLANLRKTLTELEVPDSALRITEVPDIESAKETRFQGSPTILVDGVDIYTGSKPVGYNYSCRVYSFDGRHTGIIPRSFIKQRLRRGISSKLY